jgi:ABC-2 type transport system permease protein
MKMMLTLIRRELLEHRAIFIAPAILTLIILAGATFALYQAMTSGDQLDGFLYMLEEEDPARVSVAISSFLGVAIVPFWVPFNLVMSVVFFFYLLDSLHGERKDRSVLFWRSLPVSDARTVLSKLLTALVAIPAVELLAVLVAFVLNAGVLSAGLAVLGLDPLELLWLRAPWASGSLFLAYALVTQSLWYAPFAGWLLLVSSAARNAPFLWALGVPAAIAYLEYLLFSTRFFLDGIVNHLGGWSDAVMPGDISMAIESDDFGGLLDQAMASQTPLSLLDTVDPVGFLSSPALWAGLLLTVVFLAAAVRLRRFHDV